MTIGGGWGGVAVWAALGLAGSKSPFPIPFDPVDPLRKPHLGSKHGFLSPQAFFCGALWIKIAISNPVCLC